MRLRIGDPYPGDPGANALAAFSVAAPVMMIVPALLTLLWSYWLIRRSVGVVPYAPAAAAQWHLVQLRLGIGLAVGAVGQLAMVAAVLLRLRRAGVALAGIMAAGWLAGYAFWGPGWSPGGATVLAF